MSIETRETSNKTVTIWFKRTTGFGNEKTTTYDVATTQACYQQGGSTNRTDTMGVEFNPQSTFWMEVLSENPSYGDFIALGDQSLIAKPSDADKAEAIRIVALQDCSELGDIDDLEIVT